MIKKSLVQGSVCQNLFVAYISQSFSVVLHFEFVGYLGFGFRLPKSKSNSAFFLKTEGLKVEDNNVAFHLMETSPII